MIRAPVPDSFEHRFWSKTDRPSRAGSCWNWVGPINNRGYGRFNVGRRFSEYAHRFAWRIANGSIPDGLQIDHLCRNRKCVNPAHLEVVTPRQNTLRGTSPSAAHARQDRCIHGHLFDGSYRRRGKTIRRCLTCHARRERERNAARGSNT